MGKGNKVLIVEDEIMIAMLYKSNLEKSGYHVFEPVESGEKAIEAVKEKGPHLILMDICLGLGIDGVEAAKEILEIDNKIKIIFISGYGDDATIKRIEELGAYQLVAKPVTIKRLMEIIEKEMAH
ncbi:MAG: response regulator [Deltaproteobacteria bacterium]|nr:response regulator [Deltaproteobacteria bacterium]